MSQDKKFMTVDGNTAAAYASYAFTEVAGIYPITPSSPMADLTDQWAQEGRKNIFDQTVNVVEMQSEAGAAGFVHGSLNAGALTTTYTASQGLLLMIPNMYKIAGELLPGVFHVSARAVASHALSIFGDHSDVMACRATGFAMLASSSVQEVMDLTCVSHLAAIKGRVPFCNFFDGFRTSHEISKIEVIDYEDLKRVVDWDAIKEFRERSLSPNHPTLRGSAQNPDVFFQSREASNPFYDRVPSIVEYYMDKIKDITGREYHLFNYEGAEDATDVIIAMGSICDTVAETVRVLNEKGRKVGLVNVHLYRPFVPERLLEAIPETCERIAVLDRTKEPGAHGEPLLLDVKAVFHDCEDRDPLIIGGRYGLGSKDTIPDDILACFDNLAAQEPKERFTLAITDDITHLSLPREEHMGVSDPSTISCRFWGLGSDGTVGANKNSIKIIGDHTEKYAQAYFSYDSKKSGGITVSDLRFGDKPIRQPYLIDRADFISCSQQSYVSRYDMLRPLKEGGTFLLNTWWTDDELEEHLPSFFKRQIADKGIKFYTINAIEIAQEIGLGGRTNTVLQSAFFKLANILPIDEAVTYMKEKINKSYGKKGEAIVKMNYNAVDAGTMYIHEVKVPEHWKSIEINDSIFTSRPDTPFPFIENIADVINAQEGDRLTVADMADYVDGTLPQGSSRYEKRGVAVNVPKWVSENCIQCNQCSYVCPHAVIRPFLVTDEEADAAPAGTEFLQGTKPYNDYKFKIQVSLLDCTGCGSCANVCPAKEKALIMTPIDELREDEERWEYFTHLPRKKNPMKLNAVKGTQFEQPLFEFSGACAGCGETPYVKLVTQLFGDRMQISNATGCSSIYGGSCPSTPYCKNEEGHGPSWANSLFEDNAENGLGMHMATCQIRGRISEMLNVLAEGSASEDVRSASQRWVDNRYNAEDTREISSDLISTLEERLPNATEREGEIINKVLELKDYFVKRSTWIFGGDGWAYDIGYGGVDHVLASGHDINILVLDTEVYSNTGGQASKSTQTGAIAQFAAGGKETRKKDLGMMAMSYGYVYVAQVAMGANQAQTLKAFSEAESYPGPSLVIAYAPCINHGIRGNLTISQTVEKDAVECGYWHLYRYDPRLEKANKNPFQLDSKPPKGDFIAFLKREVRYNALAKKYPADVVDQIYRTAKKNADARYFSYLRMLRGWEAAQEDFNKAMEAQIKAAAKRIEESASAVTK